MISGMKLVTNKDTIADISLLKQSLKLGSDIKMTIAINTFDISSDAINKVYWVT